MKMSFAFWTHTWYTCLHPQVLSCKTFSLQLMLERSSDALSMPCYMLRWKMNTKRMLPAPQSQHGGPHSLSSSALSALRLNGNGVPTPTIRPSLSGLGVIGRTLSLAGPSTLTGHASHLQGLSPASPKLSGGSSPFGHRSEGPSDSYGQAAGRGSYGAGHVRGHTPFQYAVLAGEEGRPVWTHMVEKCGQEVLELKSGVLQQTYLHWAAEMGHAPLVAYLLRRGKSHVCRV